jgi:hypothetical protein
MPNLVEEAGRAAAVAGVVSATLTSRIRKRPRSRTQSVQAQALGPSSFFRRSISSNIFSSIARAAERWRAKGIEEALRRHPQGGRYRAAPLSVFDLAKLCSESTPRR